MAATDPLVAKHGRGVAARVPHRADRRRWLAPLAGVFLFLASAGLLLTQSGLAPARRAGAQGTAVVRLSLAALAPFRAPEPALTLLRAALRASPTSRQ